MTRVLLLLLLCSPLAAGAAEGCRNLSGLPIIQGVLWDDVWEAMDSTSNCTQNCHLGFVPAGDLDLSNRQLSIYFLVGQLSAQSGASQRVIPGDPRRSLLFQKIACETPDVGMPMPPGGHVPPLLQELIYDWIEQGAYGESAEDPIPRDFLFRDSMESLRCVVDGQTADHRACTGIKQPWRGTRS
ncbi:hypothetical protein [Pseudomarimonas salicorniae]|uniref:Cytochrome C Planctomycete-type domain-containing protein n=1 Tax=Pseudomarimonas salicorniae TaxID=2933270 RepID=A0ABT0GMB5_9GAMM|nr:hypothetical protein [Lysobacter sp. CAU 1642]MCK7595364.1 hypothetical protein [Lysobacter sp. CAU 1642]